MLAHGCWHTANGGGVIEPAREWGGVAAYGAGVQVHVEDLAAYLAGRERCDANARFEELFPAYEELAAKVG